MAKGEAYRCIHPTSPASLSLPQGVHFLRCVPPTLDARPLGPPLQPVCINSTGLPRGCWHLGVPSPGSNSSLGSCQGREDKHMAPASLH